MELVRALERPPPSWWTEAGAQLLQDRATTSLISSSLSWTSASSAQQHISVQRASLHDLFSFASSIPINSRTSVEAMLRGTRIRMLEMRLKMQHTFPRPQTQEKSLDHAGLIGLTAATDLKRRHRMTLESTLGVHRTLTFFSRYNSDDYARNQFILQVVHKLNEKTTLSPIFSVSSGCHPQAGLSLTRQLTEMGFLGNNSLQVKGFYSGGGAYSVSIKAQAGQVD